MTEAAVILNRQVGDGVTFDLWPGFVAVAPTVDLQPIGTRIDVTPWADYTSTVGSWAFLADAGAAGGGWLRNTSDADGDAVSFDVYLVAGSWQVTWLGAWGPSGAIVVPSIGVTDGSPIDLYAAGASANHRAVDTFTVAEDGVATISFTVTGRNGSSAGYQAAVQSLSLLRVTPGGG